MIATEFVRELFVVSDPGAEERARRTAQWHEVEGLVLSLKARHPPYLTSASRHATIRTLQGWLAQNTRWAAPGKEATHPY